MSAQYTDTYQVGVTLVTVTTSTPVQVKPDKNVVGWQFKKASGGTLALVHSTGFSSTQGYILADTETYAITGPATFFLAAGGATTVVAVTARYSKGYSLFP